MLFRSGGGSAGSGGVGRYSTGPVPGSAIDTHSNTHNTPHNTAHSTTHSNTHNTTHSAHSQHQHQQQMDRDYYSQQQQLQIQQQLQHQRQQQLAEMQHNLLVRQQQLSGSRQQQNPILSHPHGHIHASHSHVHYAPQYEPTPYYHGQESSQGQGQKISGSMLQSNSALSMSRLYPTDDSGVNSNLKGVMIKGERGERGERDTHTHTQYNNGILSTLYNTDGTLCETSSLPLGGRGYVGAYSPEARRERIERFLAKRDKRVWTKKVKYDVRKNFADSRLRVKVS